MYPLPHTQPRLPPFLGFRGPLPAIGAPALLQGAEARRRRRGTAPSPPAPRGCQRRRVSAIPGMPQAQAQGIEKKRRSSRKMESAEKIIRGDERPSEITGGAQAGMREKRGWVCGWGGSERKIAESSFCAQLLERSGERSGYIKGPRVRGGGWHCGKRNSYHEGCGRGPPGLLQRPRLPGVGGGRQRPAHTNIFTRPPRRRRGPRGRQRRITGTDPRPPPPPQPPTPNPTQTHTSARFAKPPRQADSDPDSDRSGP